MPGTSVDLRIVDQAGGIERRTVPVQGTFSLGVVLEYLQGWSGYRDFDYLDMVADGCGVAVAWLLGGTAAARLLHGLERRMRA